MSMLANPAVSCSIRTRPNTDANSFCASCDFCFLPDHQLGLFAWSDAARKAIASRGHRLYSKAPYRLRRRTGRVDRHLLVH